MERVIAVWRRLVQSRAARTIPDLPDDYCPYCTGVRDGRHFCDGLGTAYLNRSSR